MFALPAPGNGTRAVLHFATVVDVQEESIKVRYIDGGCKRFSNAEFQKILAEFDVKVLDNAIEETFDKLPIAQGQDTKITTLHEHLMKTAKNAFLINKINQANGMNYVLTCTPHDIDELRYWFDRCEKEGSWIQAVYLEGVMGEGNPGEKLDPEFYKVARELTLKYDSALCIDSIQAGMRTTGNLSICDYPGFENSVPPDFEVYSKAINGGQFPVSVVALSTRGASWYRHGTYGNTMTVSICAGVE